MEAIKVLIADDQSLMRDGLATILEIEPDIKVVGRAKTGREAYQLTKEHNPDLVLMDILMSEMNGIESTKKIKAEQPGTKILALTTFDDQEYIVNILNSGAEGYLLKDIDGDRLVESIKEALAGKLIMPAEVASKLAASKTDTSNVNSQEQKKGEADFDLSEREQEVAQMLARGFTNQQIADKLYISHGTVKNYVSKIYSKLGISDRTKAALFLQNYLELE